MVSFLFALVVLNDQGERAPRVPPMSEPMLWPCRILPKANVVYSTPFVPETIYSGAF
jgi:hypothetical protein